MINAVLAFHGSHQHGRTAQLAGARHDFFEIGFINSQRVGGLVFHVVVTELHEDIIPRLQQAEHLFEPVRAEGAFHRFTGFGVIRHGHIGLKKARQHLAPAVPRLGGLIAHGGIAGQINGRHICRCNYQSTERRVVAVEFQRQLFIPFHGFRIHFPFLEVNMVADRDLRGTHIDNEGARRQRAGMNLHLLQH